MFRSAIFLIVAMLSTSACTHTMEFSEKENSEGLKYNSMMDKVYFSPQPTKQQLERLKSDERVEVVFNLRNPEEMTGDLANFGQQVQDLQMTYYNIPVQFDGKLDKAALAKLEATFMEHHKKGQKILLHCSSGNRAAAWFATHLHYHHGETVEDSLKQAKKAGMSKTAMKEKNGKIPAG